MALELDRSKPYATVHGTGDARAYLQGEFYFRTDGTLWLPPGAKPPPEKKSGKAPPEPAVKL